MRDISRTGRGPTPSGQFRSKCAIPIITSSSSMPGSKINSGMGAAENQVRFVAHSVGLELDEIPVIAPKFDAPLEPGVVLAVEPKVFYPGLGGVGVENTYVITDGACERLTVSPMEIYEM